MTAPVIGRLLGIACGIALCLPSVAAAKTISITIGQKAELRGDTLAVSATIGNTGDEAAKAVAVSLHFGDKAVRGKARDELPPSGSYEEELALAVGQLGEGRWPYEIRVDYADANLYPFQALLAYAFVVGNPPPAKITVAKFTAEPIGESGPLAITVKNLAAAEREARWRVMVPDGVEATPATGTVHLAGWGETTASIDLVNHTALAGSRYPIFVAIEYDDGAVHQGIVSQGMIEIVAPRSFWERNRLALFVGAGILVALWLALVVRRVAGRSA
jgi:hypothetical protein